MKVDAIQVAERAEGFSNSTVIEAVSTENQVKRLPQTDFQREQQSATNALLPKLELASEVPAASLERNGQQPAALERLTPRAPRQAQSQERPQETSRQQQGGDRAGDRSFQPAGDGRGAQYEVRRGDTLWDITRDYLRNNGNKYPSGSQIQEMVRRTARENGITNPGRIRPGDRIRLPQVERESSTNALPQTFRPEEQRQSATGDARTDAPQAPRTDLEQTRRPGDGLTGRPITDLDRNINPRLGCALAVSAALREVDANFPVTNNVGNLERTLRERGYQTVPHEGPINPSDLREGDIIIGVRPGQMPGHAAIYRGEGRVFENDSNTGRMTDRGDVNRFNQRMHNDRGQFQPNGFERVIILRRAS